MKKYSYSQLSSFKYCQMEYYFEYVRGIKSYTDTSFIGSLMHELLVLLEILDPKELIGYGEDKIENEIPISLTNEKQKWKQYFINMLNGIMKTPLEGQKEIEVEGEIYRPFRGFIDLLSSNGQVIDYKFRKRYRPPDPLQIFIYAELLRQNKKEVAETGKIITITWKGEVIENEYKILDPLDEVYYLIDQIEKNEFKKENNGKCKRCYFKKICEEVQK